MPETQGGDRITAAERKARVIGLRRRRLTFDQIGRALGISRQRAHQIYSAAVAELPARSAAEYDAEELDLVDNAIADLMKIAFDHDKPRTSVEAWSAARGWAEHKARLLGMNAPVKHEVRAIDAIDARLLELADEVALGDAGPAPRIPREA